MRFGVWMLSLLVVFAVVLAFWDLFSGAACSFAGGLILHFAAFDLLRYFGLWVCAFGLEFCCIGFLKLSGITFCCFCGIGVMRIFRVCLFCDLWVFLDCLGLDLVGCWFGFGVLLRGF